MPASPALRLALDGPIVIPHEHLQRLTSAPVVGLELVSSVQAHAWVEGRPFPAYHHVKAHRPALMHLLPGQVLTLRPHSRPGVVYVAPRVMAMTEEAPQ